MAGTNEGLARELISDGCLKSPLLVEAFRKIDRKDFLPRGREAALRGVPPNLEEEAYGNYPLPIGGGQTISQPLTVAFMLELLEPRPGERILDAGSGSGWTTCLLAYMAASKPRINADEYADKRGKYIGINQQNRHKSAGLVVAVERIPELCKFGEENVRKYSFVDKGIVKFFCGDASRGAPRELLPKGGFDKILAGAAAETEIPEAWKKQLKVGGRIVAPVGRSVAVLDKISEKRFGRKEHFGFSFVPLIEERRD